MKKSKIILFTMSSKIILSSLTRNLIFLPAQTKVLLVLFIECVNVCSEIAKKENDLTFLQHKHNLMGNMKSEELAEKTNEIEIIEEEIKELEIKINAYEGKGLINLDYSQLNEIEQNLLNLLVKSKEKKTILQEELMNDPLEEYNNNLKCKVCLNNELNVISRPCNHLCMCLECVYSTIKCPECFEDIEYYDKVFMPD